MKKTYAFFLLAVLGLLCHVSAFVRRREASPHPQTDSRLHKRAAFALPHRDGNYTALSSTNQATRKNRLYKNKENQSSSSRIAERFGNSLSFHGGLITVV